MRPLRFALRAVAILACGIALTGPQPALAQDAPSTDDLVARLIARDAPGFTADVAARMPASYAKVKEQVTSSAPGLQRLLNGLAPTSADPGVNRAPTASVRCRSYLIHGASPFSVVFHLYNPGPGWQLLAFNLKQLAPENHATYVRQMCEGRPIEK